MSLLKEAGRKIRRWRENPKACVAENFLGPDGVLDHWQEEFLEVLPSQDADKIRISLQACTGPGKSAALAWAGWVILGCYGEPGDHPKGAALSITADNLKDNLWAELSKWQSRSQYFSRAFVWTKERIFAKDHPATWFLSARSFAKTANAEEMGRTLSGLHSGYPFVLIDESGEIPLPVMKAAEQILSSEYKWAKIVQAGNPTSHAGMLYAAAKAFRHLWYVIRITGDPDNPRRSRRINIENARAQILAHGRENPWVMATILGEFPPASINALLSPDEVEEAFLRQIQEEDYRYAQKRIGVDVARFGDDRTVIFGRQGLRALAPVEMRNARTNDIAARVMLAKQRFESEVECVDGTGGWGAGVIDALIQAGHAPIEVNFSGKAIDPRYFNKRAEMWFEMADWIRRGGSLVKGANLVRELTAPTYSFRNGKLILEEKDQIKERLGFSPDLADALALTFALPEMPGALPYPETLVDKRANKIPADYDPLRESRT